MTSRRVVVLGGGACGMTAALHLAQAGARVTLLERESRPGGLCGTHERNGFRFDLGGHRFLTRSRALEAMVRGLLGADLLERRRASAVLHRGRRFHYPLELDDLLRRTGWLEGAGALASYGLERARQLVSPQPDETFEDWVSHRFGRRLYDSFFGPYTEKLWGLPPDQISADWASQRISLLSLSDVMMRLAGLRRGGARTYARRYLYPRLGIGQIFERMGEATVAAGGAVKLGATVTGLEHRRGRIRAVRYRDADGEHELPCDDVISTLSLPLCAGMLGAPAAVAAAGQRLRFRAIRLLNVLLDLPEVSPYTWMYVSEPRYLAARIQEPRQRSPAAAPPGKTSLMLEIPCQVGDAVWAAPDATIYARCMDDLEQLGVAGARAATIDYFSSFVPEGYPVYHLGYGADRTRVLAWLGETENIVSCGRQGAFRYVFMDTAMEMGLAAAAAVLAGRRADVAGLHGERGLVEAAALTA